MNSNFNIEQGHILIYRVFDVAEEINLPQVEKLSASSAGSDSRLKIAGGRHHGVIVKNAPVRLNLGSMDIALGSNPYRVETTATVWDYGAISVCFQLPIQKAMSWEALHQFASSVTNDPSWIAEIDKMGRIRSQELCRIIESAIKKHNEWEYSEDYVVYFIEKMAGIEDGSDFNKKLNVPALLLGERSEPLSDATRSSIEDQSFQYGKHDFAMIDWNSALVYEPTGNREIVDVIEFALTHLLELRFYDDLLDHRLNELYDSLESGRHKLFRNHSASVLKEANTRFIEFSEFTERIENSLKVVGDFYLAVIFRGAAKRFRIGDWQASIARKMNLMARVSELIQGEINVRRSHALEIIVILLILFEIVTAMLNVAHS